MDVAKYARLCPDRKLREGDANLLAFKAPVPIYYLHGRPDSYLAPLLDISYGPEHRFTTREWRAQYVPFVVAVSHGVGGPGSLANATLDLTDDATILQARELCPETQSFASNLFLTFLAFFEYLLRERPDEQWFVVSEDDFLLTNQKILHNELLWCLSQLQQPLSAGMKWHLGFYLLASNTASCYYGHGMTLFFVERAFLEELVADLRSQPALVCTAPIDIYLSSRYHFFKNTRLDIGAHVGQRYVKSVFF
jgi:hypothetical protein